MANDSRSGSKIKDDETNSSKKGSSTSGSGTADTSGLRRSTRETPSKKQMTSSPSDTRKSVRLEMRMPATPPVKKKSERVEKQRMPSPLRRSDRGKKQTSSSSSGSKKSEEGSASSDLKRKKGKTKKLVKRLTVEANKIGIVERRGVEPFNTKRKRMDGHTYKTLFTTLLRRVTKTDDDKELERQEKSSQGDRSSGGGSGSEQVEVREGRGDECSGWMGEELKVKSVEKASERGLRRSNSSSRNFDMETLGNHVEVQSSYSTGKHSFTKKPYEALDADGIKASKSGDIVDKTLDDAKRVLSNRSKEEKLQALKLVDSASVGKSLDGDIDLGSGYKAIPSKRTSFAVDKNSDTSATVARNDMCTSVAAAVSLPSSSCKVDDVIKSQVACYERRRGEIEATATTGLAEKGDGIMQQNKALLDNQIDVNESICIICKRGGKLRCCDGKGCKKSYHLSCLDPPLYDVPPGVWHCVWCVKKKIESVHSVSEGVELIWDSREVEVSDDEGLRRQKQYFVKYKGLAHIHNQWIPETQLLLEVPSLVTKFNKKNQVVKWNAEWTVPHRLLKKRLLMFPKQQNEYNSEHAGEMLGCQYEWLVRWCGLDYEHATWELESASFLSSSQGQNLMREYENRRKKAKGAAISVDKSRKEPLVKLSKLPAGSPPGFDNTHLNNVNKLREYWHRGQSAVVFDEQERGMKVLLSVLLSLSNVSRPFLIITTPDALCRWEAEFSRWAPSIDIVVYSGNKDTRKSIRTLEFYKEGGGIMFQVLLSPVENVIEDLQMLACLRWEVIIIDECQHSKISTHFEHIKKLATGIMVLLFSGPVKESIAEYRNLLSLLDCRGDLAISDISKSESNDNLGKLKERLSQCTAYDCKSDASRFVEFWVPVQISNVQLEHYCATLLSNSISLCSCSKNDPVGALRDILISTRKCCDHPYIVDPSLQVLITKGLPATEYLDIGIKASGKLQLLDVILTELKNRQLRVLILFQSIGGSGRDSIGDILDDFLRQRFGPDSYERLDGGVVVPSKKQAALNKFNKESGRFVFLLENRACLPSIKLSSVDTIVIYDSDWNPMNDIRALHRISIDSQSEQIKVFRFFSSCTVEEKVLILAKNDLTLDSNFHNISRSTSETLLMWGASYLFNKLDEFHSASVANISSEQSLLNNVVKEFVALLSQNGKTNDTSTSIILKVQQRGGSYSTNLSLLGELKIQFSDREQPHVFWTKLFQGRNPHWKYSSGQTQRHRKRVQGFDDVLKKPEAETDEIGKKRKKVVAHCMDPDTIRPGVEEGEVAGVKGGASGIRADNGTQSLPRSVACVSDVLYTNHASKLLFSSDSSLLPEVHMIEPEEKMVSDAQKSLLFLLKPKISRLSEILKLSEDAKVMAGRFLEHVIENHHVNREPGNILQAFLISLCWIAASLLKHKIDRKESLLLAKKHLNFICKEEEADQVYSKLRLLKKGFLSRAENIKESVFSKDSRSASEDITKEPLEISQNQGFADEQVHLQQEKALNYKMEKEEMPNSTKPAQRKYEKQMTELLRKQQEEIQEFHKIWEEKREQLEKNHRLESAFVRSIHSHIPVRMDKLKILDNELSKKKEEHKCQKDKCLKDLEARQLSARSNERQKASHWLAEAKSSASDHKTHNGSEIVDKTVHNTSEIVPEGGVGCSIPSGTLNDQNPKSQNDGENMASEKATESRIEQPCIVGYSSESSENIVSTNPPNSEKQVPDGIISSVQGEEIPSELPETIPNDMVRGVGSVETGTPAVECNQENDRTEAIGSDAQNDVLNQCDGANNFVSGGSPSVQPVVSMTFDSSLPQNLVLQNESQSLESVEMQDEYGPVQGYQSSLQQDEVPPLQPVDGGQSDQSNPEAPLNAPFERIQPSLSTNLPLHTEHQVASRMATLPLYGDPLQNEIERIRRETEQVIKVHEDTKVRLKFECEKEIEETIAQIRRKYELELKDAEAAFLQKKVELDTNQNKVLMNKLLAEAFMSKFRDLRPSPGSLGMLQVFPHGFMLPETLQPTPRPSPVTSSSLVGQPAATQRNMPPPPQVIHRPAPLMLPETLQPTPRPSPVTSSSLVGQPAATQQNMPPPLQVVHRPAPLFPSIPTRPLIINPITPSTGNLRSGGEIRAPAPHLQRFRPPSMSAAGLASLSRVIPNQQAPSPATSPSFLHPLHRPSPPRSSSQPPPPPPPLPMDHCRPFSRPSQRENAGGFQTPNNSSSGSQPNILPPLIINSLDPSQFGTLGSRQVSSSPSAVATDIVCLSDDD